MTQNYLSVEPEGIPEVLKEIPAWTVWREVNGKKPPVIAETGKPDPNWKDASMTFEEAYNAYRHHAYDGVGMVLRPDLELCVLDYDEDLSTYEKHKLDTYVEISPSGSGVHAVGWHDNLDISIHPEGFGVFTKNRFICFTGRSLGVTEDVGNITQQVRRILGMKDASEILFDKLKTNKRFSALWTFNVASPSQSEREIALCQVMKDLGYKMEDFITVCKAYRARAMDMFPKMDKSKLHREDYFIRTWEAVPESRRLSNILTLQEVREMEEPKWLVTDIIPTPSLGMIWGPSGIGKTFVTLDFALSLTRSSDWLGNTTSLAQKKILYAYTEGARGLQDRLAAWEMLNGPADDSKIGVQFDAIQLGSEGAGYNISTLIKNTFGDISVLILDTLSRCTVGVDENSAQSVGLVVDAVETIKEELQCVVILVHHAGKETIGARGSSAYEGACDWSIEISPLRFKQGNEGNAIIKNSVAISCTKARSTEPFEPAVGLIQPVEGTQSAVFQYSKQITEFMRKRQEMKEISPDAISEIIGLCGHNMSSSEIAKATAVDVSVVEYVLKGLTYQSPHKKK